MLGPSVAGACHAHIPVPHLQVDDILEHGEFPRIPQSGSLVVWGVRVREERSGTSTPLLQGAGPTALPGNADSWHAFGQAHVTRGTLACTGNKGLTLAP